MNEETIIEKKNQPVENNKQDQPWKAVSLGGVAGILMGAGAMYAANAHAEESPEVENKEENTAENASEVPVQEANVSDNLSFSEAFSAARAEVGPGGVFHWHGGIYNTYTAAEWEAMSDAEKDAFAQRVAPEVEASAVSTPTDAQPEVVVVHHVHHVVSDEPVPTNQDDDVHIVATGEVEGHIAVALDVNGDNSADVVVIDANDNGELDYNDVAVNARGDVATIGEIVNGHQPDVSIVSEDNTPAPPDNDVRIVGVAEYEGHAVAGVDTTGDGNADFAWVDVDNSGDVSAPDVIVTPEGEVASVDEIMNASDPNAGYYDVDNADVQDYTDPNADLMSV